MKLAIYTSDGGELQIADMANDSLLEFVEALEEGTQRLFHFDLDGGDVQVWVNVDHIVRIDIT